MRSDLPTGTVTFLFTDIEGSTRLLHAVGPEVYASALADHRRVLREVFARYGGVEVDTQGDAFFVAFPTPQGAAHAARDGATALADGPIRVRMGLHTGTPALTGEGYIGVDVHRGARVGALAHGGQIVVSPSTAALLEDQALRDLGTHRIKDFESSIRLYQLGLDDFPPLRTRGSIEIPTPTTRFLGREGELFEAVQVVYERDPRVLTILGPGGTGKTRFALELCRLLAEDAEGGTVFVALAALQDPSLVLPTIADRLGAASGELAAIAARIGDERTHVLADNLEHLLPDAATSLAELAAAVPTLRLFITSRQALRVQGEHEFDLPPLVEREAVVLFCERAQSVRSDVTATAAVHRLCERLDCLPLALELAAARTKLLSPEALVERLGESLDLLKGTRDADERHATLRATIAWSYDLLDEDEQRLFRKLSVFRGGSTIESAEVVCDADLDTLASLLDKSLVRRRTGSLGEERFWMLATIREFATEQLAESGETIDLGHRHAERMLGLARAAHLSDDDMPAEVGAALAERDNFRAALDWAEQHDPKLGLELAVELQHLWNAASPDEGRQRIERLLDRTPSISQDLRASALRVYGGTCDLSGRSDEAERLWEESLALYRELGDDRGIAGVEHMLAVSAWRREDWDRMRELTEHSLALARDRFPFVETTGLYLLGELARVDGDLDRATDLTRESAQLAHDAGWTWWESGQLHALLMLALERGDVEEAERNGRAALHLERAQENRLWTLYTIAGLAQVAHATGDLGRAGLLWGAAEREAERLPRWPDERARRGGALVEESEPAFTTAVENGRRIELWDVVAIALGADEPDQTVP